ncbi:acyltransferase family protein [Microbacter sp. GSS18]|nr:acyltransferase family protein [Microbacter sp. GSS18]
MTGSATSRSPHPSPAPVAPGDARAGESGRPGGMRADIQALRAVAVMAVVLYHLWPGALPGGYVGVDVFFVISGFLITDHLMRRQERTGRISLAGFWSARARRLLPAALTVLLASVVMTVTLAPATLQGQYLRSVIGSALYIENWQLAFDAVDYLGQENEPPIAQHYWSLSVEEQFYLLWPLLIIAAVLLAARLGLRPRRVLVAVLFAVAGVSFALSTWTSITTPGIGYFATYSRMWEFALGAFVSLAPAWRAGAPARAIVWFGGWVALAVSLFAFGPDTVFPGPSALLPTAATAALIALGPRGPVPALDRVVALPPVQWLGDHSYGIYLWHWPFVIMAPWVLGHPTDLLSNVAILALSLVAAAATKKWIEDPVRFGAAARRWRPRHVGAMVAAAMAFVVVAASMPLAAAWATGSQQSEQTVAALPDPANCLGANAMAAAGCDDAQSEVTSAADLVPALATLYEDTGGAYRCYDQKPSPDPTTCTIGSTGPDAVRVALVGDSHAAMLIPALEVIGERDDWSVDVYVGRGCRWYADEPDADCAARQQAIDARVLSGDYDLLIETGRNSAEYSRQDQDAKAAALAQRWAQAQRNGTVVAAVADNPEVPPTSSECLATTDEFAFDTCAFVRSGRTMDADPLRAAAAASGAALVDLTAEYCRDQTCPMVVGGVVVYRDAHHITASFSRTLVPALSGGLTAALGTGD